MKKGVRGENVAHEVTFLLRAGTQRLVIIGHDDALLLHETDLLLVMTCEGEGGGVGGCRGGSLAGREGSVAVGRRSAVEHGRN